MNKKHCCCCKSKKVYANYCHFNVYKTRARPVFETNLHMINHYKRVNSAKGVVNTSAPRSHQLRYKNVSNFNSRYSSPTLLSSSERIPSRANSNCEVRKRMKCNVKLDETRGERSSSVPPRPCTRRNPNVVPQNYLKTTKHAPKIHDNINTKKIPIRDETHASSTANSPKQSPKSKPNKSNKLTDALKVIPIKIPVPAPRHSFAAPGKPAVEDYEYLQFSLRITEDIIRNNLYTQKEMRRVFNSHIEANRGRLNMTKMLKQIDHLCKELNMSKKASGNRITNKETCPEKCSCTTKQLVATKESSGSLLSKESEASGSTKSYSENSKEEILQKVIGGQYDITEEEINELTESDLQDVITKILNDDSELCSVCKMNKEPQNISASKLNKSPIKNDFDVIHSNVDKFCSESAENFKTYAASSGTSIPSNEVKQNEPEEQYVDHKEFACSCDDDKEIKVRNLKDYPGAQFSPDAYDKILKSLLKNSPKDIENKELQKRCDEQLKILNICMVEPVCSRKLKIAAVLQENKAEGPILSEHAIKNLELCLLDTTCSGLHGKESNDSKKSGNWSTFESSVQENDEKSTEVELSTKLHDMCLLNSVCSKKNYSNQNLLCLVEPICPGKKNIGHTSKDLCSVKEICSKNEQISSDGEPATKEENKTSSVGSVDKIIVELVAKVTEQSKSGNVGSVNKIISELIAKVIEQKKIEAVSSFETVPKGFEDTNPEVQLNKSNDQNFSKLLTYINEQFISDEESTTKEQNTNKTSNYLVDKISSKNSKDSELTSDIRAATEQNKTKYLSSGDTVFPKTGNEETDSYFQAVNVNLLGSCPKKPKEKTSVDTICSKLKEDEQTSSDIQPATEEQNAGEDLSLDQYSSKLKSKEIEQISSDNQSRTVEKISSNDLVDQISSQIKSKGSAGSKGSEQIIINSDNQSKISSNDLVDQISSQIKSKGSAGSKGSEDIIQGIGSSSPRKSKEKTSVDTICSKLKESELTTWDIQPATREQNTKEDLYLYQKISPIKSKEVEQIVSDGQPATVKKNTSKDLYLVDQNSYKTKSKGSAGSQESEQIIADVQFQSVCSSSPKKSKENEVSIVAQTIPVDKMGSASRKSIEIENKTTQTSIAATQNPESVSSPKSDKAGVFYYYNSMPSNSKNEETIIVYDNDNKSNLDSVDQIEQEKQDFISSITRFILDKTFANVRRDSNCSNYANRIYPIYSEKKEEGKRKSEEKTDFVSSIEKLINERTQDLYQYSIQDNEKSFHQPEGGFTLDSLDLYRSEYTSKYEISPKISRRKSSVSSKNTESTFSEGEIISSTNVSCIKKLNHKTTRKSEPEILEHLKKYEQIRTSRISRTSSKTSNFLRPCICDYEIKNYTDYEKYVPKYRRSFFFPAASTQTSSPNINYKINCNDNLLSDGEIRNTSSEPDDTKTDLSDNCSWR